MVYRFFYWLNVVISELICGWFYVISLYFLTAYKTRLYLTKGQLCQILHKLVFKFAGYFCRKPWRRVRTVVAAVGTIPRLVEAKKETGTSSLNEISTDQLGNKVVEAGRRALTSLSSFSRHREGR
jgi:hypothetical protein